MGIIKQFKDWLQRKRSHAIAKRKLSLRLQSEDLIQVREFKGEIYLSYRDVPLLRISELAPDTPQVLTRVRDTYVEYMTNSPSLF